MQKCAAPTSNVEEGGGVEIKTVRSNKDVYLKNKVERPTYLNTDKEVLVVALEEIEGGHELPI